VVSPAPSGGATTEPSRRSGANRGASTATAVSLPGPSTSYISSVTGAGSNETDRSTTMLTNASSSVVMAVESVPEPGRKKRGGASKRAMPRTSSVSPARATRV